MESFLTCMLNRDPIRLMIFWIVDCSHVIVFEGLNPFLIKLQIQVMIYMIEGILPECYFNNNMRGLSVDMAVFRDLLKLRLPRLSKHLDNLQYAENKEGSKGNILYFITLIKVIYICLKYFKTFQYRLNIVKVLFMFQVVSNLL